MIRAVRHFATVSSNSTDMELLRRFASHRDEPAFTELVRRHGPLVLAVCRRVVGDAHLAEDAFQATFVVLARKAETIRHCELSTWLYSVAVKVSLRARTMAGRRAKRETLTDRVPEREVPSATPDDIVSIIDAEIDRLPEHLRAAVVFCELRGLSRKAAATELGIAEGTLSSRLAAARKRLAHRLKDRGVVPGLALTVTLPVFVPPHLAAATLSLCAENAGLTPQLATLVEGGMKMALAGKLKLAIVAITVMMLTVGGLGRGWKNETLAAPVPKEAADPGLIWVVDAKAGELIAYTPSGKHDRRLGLKDVHPPTDVLLGVVQDGQKLAFARPLKQGAGLTLHLRDLISDKMTDTGIRMDFAAEWEDVLRVPQFGWVASGRHALLSERKQEKPYSPLKYTLVDLETLTQVPIELPWNHIPADVSRDGRQLLSVCPGPHGGRMAFYLSDTSGGKPVLIPFQENMTAGSSSFVGRLAPDGQSILFKGSARSGEREDWRQGTFVFRIENGGTSVVEREGAELDRRIADRNLSWSPDGHRVAAGWTLSGYTRPRGGIRVCDPDGRNPSQAEAFRPTETPGLFLGWFPTPKASPVPKPDVEWKEGKPIQFDTHPHGDRVTSVAYSPDGKWIAVAVGEQVRLLDAATRRQVNEHALAAKAPGTITAVAFSPKGDKLAMTARDYVIIYSELGQSPSSSTDRSWAMKGFDPIQVTWLSDDQLVASNGEEVAWRIPDEEDDIRWKLANGKRGQLSVLAAIPNSSAVLLTRGEFEKNVNNVAFVARQSGSSLWVHLSGHKSRPIAAVVSKDAKRIVTADAGGTLIVWEGKTLAYQEKARIELGEGVAQLALAPDGKTVAVLRAFTDADLLGTSGRMLMNLELSVFDVTDLPKDRKPLWQVRGLLSDAKTLTAPASLAFAPDGKMLLAAFADPYIANKDAKSLGVKVWTLGHKR